LRIHARGKNTGLERNLEKQLPIYQAANDAKNGIKVIRAVFNASAMACRVVAPSLQIALMVGAKSAARSDARFRLSAAPRCCTSRLIVTGCPSLERMRRPPRTEPKP
jgi:hypothetical protein